ncbi:unnamed protein product [Anisakis simplex]|uniref:Vegetative cell wall protein gp1-like n=1 Tax=Anisakis simplex TaxID=6269 RepID=A0A0M3J6K1_ANISI|nr:unnamed protein product [Anisakis simplex]
MDQFGAISGSERAVDVPAPLLSLPPRPPARIPSKPQSRPPPPPYNVKTNKSSAQTSSNKAPPPPYPGRSATPNSNADSDFVSQTSSVPKFSRKPCATPAVVVGEGERRETIRDKEERQEKAMSVYENVDSNEQLPVKGVNLWYEYGSWELTPAQA